MKKTFFFIFFFLFFRFFCQTPLNDFKKLAETKPDSALKIWKNVYMDSDEKDKVKVLLSVCQAFLLKGDNKMALEYIIKAEEGAKQLDDPLLYSEVLLYKSGAYAAVGLYKEALTYAKEGIKETDKIKDVKDKNGIAADLYYMQAIYNNNKQSKSTNLIPLFKKMIILYQQSNLSDYEKEKRLQITYYNLGNIYIDKSKIDSAGYYLEKIIEHPTTDNIFIQGATFEKLGEIEYQKNNFDKSLMYLNKATEVLKKFKDPNLAINYAVLSSIYESKGEIEKALYYKKLQNTFDRSLEDSQKKGFRFAYDSLEKKRLTTERRESDLKKRLIGIGIVFMIFIILFIYYNHKRKEKQKIVYQEIITKLERRLEETQNITIDDTDKKQKTIGVLETVERDLLKKLDKFEASEKFTNPKLSLSLLAAQFNTNANYLSEVINVHKGKNFSSYINELRIDYICRKIINEPEYHSYKISYLAESCGFSSHSAFAKTFKSVTNISPSVFIRETHEKEIENV